MVRSDLEGTDEFRRVRLQGYHRRIELKDTDGNKRKGRV